MSKQDINNRKRSDAQFIANKELIFQNKKKEKLAAKLVIANKELTFQNKKEEKRVTDLSIANIGLIFQNLKKNKQAAELVIANKEINFQNKEKKKRAAELNIANKELAFQNEEKEKRAAELGIANIELDFQKKEKEKQAVELVIANEELAFQNEEVSGRTAQLEFALKKLRESEVKYRLLAEELLAVNVLLTRKQKKLKEAQAIAHLGNWEIDIINNEHFWSDELYTIFGVTKNEYTPSKEAFLSSIHPDDLQFSKEKIEEAFSSLTNSFFNFRFIRKDGSVRYAHSEYRFDLDKDGKPLRLYGILQDITKRVKAKSNMLKKNKQLKDLFNHLQYVREEERTSLAREIHDELGQQLTVLKMDIDWVLYKHVDLDKTIVAKLHEMLKINGGIINTVRRISSNLRPAIIDELGVVAAIEWQCGDFEEKMGIPCKFISNVKERKFNAHFSINVYRIIQETLTNISRHAEAKNVTISLTENEKEFFIEITDDGKGITKENMRDSKRLGLLGMKERAYLLDGEILISGTKNKGTQVKLILPIKNEYTNS